LIAARLTRASGSLRFSITFQYPRDYGAREGYWNTSRGMNVGGLLFACFCFVALLLCCFLAFPVLCVCPSASEPFSSVWLPIIPLPFHSVPYHTTPFELNERAPDQVVIGSGCTRVFVLFFLFDSLSLQIHLHYEAVFVCLLRLWSQSSNARYIVPPHAFGIPSFETFIFAQFQHFSNPRLVEVAGGLLPFFPSFPVWACVEGAVCAGLVVYG
jgi:hypothetical protein